MSKEKNGGSKETSTELAKPQSKELADLTVQAQSLAKMTPGEQLKALERDLGIGADEVEVIAAGKLPFWPAYAGAVLIGTIQGRREVKTQFRSPTNPDGVVGLYTVKVEQKPCLAGTLDGEVFELHPGDNISVLERSVMKELRTRIGQQVAILCVGKTQGKQFSYWDYKILGKKRDAAQIQAASMQAMAAVQAKQLEGPRDE